MPEKFDRRVDVRNSDGVVTVALDADGPGIHVGGQGHAGQVVVYPSDATSTAEATITLEAGPAALRLGNTGAAGILYLRDARGNNTIHLSGSTANLTLGGNEQDGDLVLKNGSGIDTIHLDGGDAGNLYLRDARGNNTIHLSGSTANLVLGGNEQNGDILLKNGSGVETIHLDGHSGDITLLNADCAEDFEVSDPGALQPGMVVVIEESSRLGRCAHAYDKRVAGVLAGANSAGPGIVLGRIPGDEHRLPVALFGKVYCKVDAKFGPIETGDLLTTSPTPGYAMKATDSRRAFGAVIGKALQSLDEGQGLIPVLVALQ